jgi:hypothetical protein
MKYQLSVYALIIASISFCPQVTANPLHIFTAVVQGNIDRVRKIIEKDPKEIFQYIGFYAVQDATPLKLAIGYARFDIAHLLVDKGAYFDNNGVVYLNTKIEATRIDLEKTDDYVKLAEKISTKKLEFTTNIEKCILKIMKSNLQDLLMKRINSDRTQAIMTNINCSNLIFLASLQRK